MGWADYFNKSNRKSNKSNKSNILSCRKQRVVLNGQHSSWADVKVSVPHGTILGLLLFLIYINDLPNGLNSNVKLFADDMLSFSVAPNINDWANLLNSDLL